MTAPRATLPDAPQVELETVGESRLAEGGFLTLRRLTLRRTEAAASPSFPYDVVDRRALDAAVVVAHHRTEDRVWVWLRSSLRPPLALRSDGVTPALWEVAAGLIEPNESPSEAAARELAEELGFRVAASALQPLGPAGFPAPAMIGEKHFFFHVEVDPAAREEPEGDGSPVEAGAEIVCVPLAEALAACRRGVIADEKTELALRRLHDEIGERA